MTGILHQKKYENLQRKLQTMLNLFRAKAMHAMEHWKQVMLTSASQSSQPVNSIQFDTIDFFPRMLVFVRDLYNTYNLFCVLRIHDYLRQPFVVAILYGITGWRSLKKYV